MTFDFEHKSSHGITVLSLMEPNQDEKGIWAKNGNNVFPPEKLFPDTR
jgi:hypothetical protein